MSRPSSLTVVVPRLMERLTHARSNDAAGEESLIAYLAGRGDIAHRWDASRIEAARSKPWQRGLLAVLGVDERHAPSASITALGQAAPNDCADWLHAEPIHLAAGLNEVALVPLAQELELARVERDAMTPVLQEHLASEALVLRPAGDNGWLIGSTSSFAIDTVIAEFAKRNEWNAVLPQGAGASRARRLMTELQMLLHEHPVNEARINRGLPSANALWLWGSGERSPRTMSAAATCMGDDDYLRGLCKANGWTAPQGLPSFDVALKACEANSAVVCVLPGVDQERFERDWLAPFVAALKSDRLERLELVLDEWLLTIDRWRLRRFWRRPMPLRSWAAA